MNSRSPSVTAIRSRSTSQNLSSFPFHCSAADRPYNDDNNILSATSSPVPLDIVPPSSQLSPPVSKASFFLADVPSSTTAQSNLASFSAAIEKSRSSLPFQLRSLPLNANNKNEERTGSPKSNCGTSSLPMVSSDALPPPNSTPITSNRSNDIDHGNTSTIVNPFSSPPPTPQNASSPSQRSLSLPDTLSSSATILKAVADNEIDDKAFADCLRSCPESTLILDIRPYPAFVKSRINGALNLCVPTTLLKRPFFNLAKLEQTFVSAEDRQRFLRWKSCKRIVVYCSTSRSIRDAASSLHVLKKFISEGFQGQCLVLRGGFNQFAIDHPDWVVEDESVPVDGPNGSSNGQLDQTRINCCTSPSAPFVSGGSKQGGGIMSLPRPTPFAPVIGGCIMPDTHSAFYGTIRQNTELLFGVERIPLSVPPLMPETVRSSLPAWLSAVSNDNGTAVADRFIKIEVAEQKRMQQALSTDPSSPKVGSKINNGNVNSNDAAMFKSGKVRLAGIEKGAKNRYNNIYPYDHSRVKLRMDSSDLCDYVNANYVQPSRSNKRYIATQAPIPATFNDFWRVVWEQNVGVIVMLTAEVEAFAIKCHQYWQTGRYGSLELVFESEKHVPLSNYHPNKKESMSNGTNGTSDTVPTPNSAPMPFAEHFAASAQKASYTPMAGLVSRGGEHQDEITIRTFSLRDASPLSTEPPRSITQVQYTGWPDFGIPARPTDVLSLLTACNTIFDEANAQSSQSHSPNDPVPYGRRNIVVHCSAGCGRTGIFCTVDSVIDMLKKQRRERTTAKRKNDGDDTMEDEENLHNDTKPRDITMKDISEERQRFPLQRKGSSATNRDSSRRQMLATERHQQQPPSMGLRRQGSKKQKVYDRDVDGYAAISKTPNGTSIANKEPKGSVDDASLKQVAQPSLSKNNPTTYTSDSYTNWESPAPFSPSNNEHAADGAKTYELLCRPSRSDNAPWVFNDDIDLIAETVEEFRQQRLSMVQTLRQFVLCYDTILEWLSLNPWPTERGKDGCEPKAQESSL